MMNRHVLVAAAFVIACAMVAGSHAQSLPTATQPASTKPTATASQPAVSSEAVGGFKAFWAALIAGDTAELGKNYADKVLLIHGCELLKPEWGIPNADRDKDMEVTRDDLVAAYGRLIAKTGKDKWKAAMGKVGWAGLHTQRVVGPHKILPSAQDGDHIFQIPVVPGEHETFTFVLRKIGNDWRVVIEQTDY